MPGTTSAILLILAVVALAGVYAPRAKHPKTRPLEASLIFATIFVVVAFVCFAATITLARSVDIVTRQPDAGLAAVLAVASFVPAFFAARQMIRRPPRTPPPV